MCSFAVEKLLTRSFTHAKSIDCSLKLRAFFTFIYVFVKSRKRDFTSFESCCARFYPRDSILAPVLAMALCLSVYLSVRSRCSIRRDERISLFFGMEASFDQCHILFLVWKFRYLQNKSTFLRHFSQTPDFGKFRHGISIVERRERWTLRA